MNLGRRRGFSFPELLVCTLIVGVVAVHTLVQTTGVVEPGSPATVAVCRSNKGRLAATLVAWQMENPRAGRPTLPGAYPSLIRQGWLEGVPSEPGTGTWSHTYRTTPKGNLVCLVHDLGWTRDLSTGEAGRVPMLELLAAMLLVATYLTWRWTRSIPRDPLGKWENSPPACFPTRLSSEILSSEAAAEVREFLASRGPSV